MDILEKICESTRERVRKEKTRLSFEDARRYAEKKEDKDKADGRENLFKKALLKPGLSFICEVKKASPSKGIIASEFPYMEIAREYEKGGADAISCLTEPEYFLGSDEYLRKIADEVRIPVLRKDFTVDPYMIYTAKMLGAQAVLLIASIMEKEELREYLDIVKSLGMSALTEAHEEAQIEKALDAGADIIGVNNRNLKDFSVNFDNAGRLRKLVPGDKIFVAESGVKDEKDIEKIRSIGADAVLIGEYLMRSDRRPDLLRKLKKG